MKFIQTILFLLSKKIFMTEDKHIDRKINEKIKIKGSIINVGSIVGEKKMVLTNFCLMDIFFLRELFHL